MLHRAPNGPRKLTVDSLQAALRGTLDQPMGLYFLSHFSYANMFKPIYLLSKALTKESASSKLAPNSQGEKALPMAREILDPQ